MKHIHPFTLIELLMTIAIVVVLAGILIPAVNSAIKKGQAAKAKAEIVTLVNAIKQYENTYNRLPQPRYDDTSNYPANGTTVKEINKYLILALQAEKYDDDNNDSTPKIAVTNKDGKATNPRNIKFLDVRAKPGEYPDPWDNDYRIIMSTDEQISLQSLGDNAKYKDDTIYQSVVIWSAGPDGEWDTKDDIHSFEAEYEAGQWHVTN